MAAGGVGVSSVKRLKVLVSAYACEPGKGSEPAVGWNWARQLSQFHEVWLITRTNNRAVIEAALADEPLPDAHFVYFDLPAWMRRWKRGQRGVRLYYYLWQIGVYFVARKLHDEVRFDLIHHVTFVKYCAPSFLALLPAPFVWGPVGGGESAPRSFRRSFSVRGKIYEVMRDCARRLGELDPFVRWTARRAALALATTAETEKRLRALGCRKTLVYPQVGLPAKELRQLAAIPVTQDNPFRIFSLGRLLHWKGFDLGLRAFARLEPSTPASEYWIIGDGPERKRLERLARKLDVAEKVVFWGAVPRDQALSKLADCDVLLHPSLHESGGWVCLEAMAAGRPVVCLDLGGPALQVTRETGIKVPADEPDTVVRGLATAMASLSQDRTLRQHMGNAARKSAREYFCWDQKGEQLNDLYHMLLSDGVVPRPAPGVERP